MSGFLRGWLRDLPLDGMLPARQRLRRLRGLAPWLRAGDPVLGRARGLPAHRQRASPAARGHEARAGALGHQPQPPLAAGAGLRLRPPRPVRGDVRPRRHQPRAHPLLQAAGAQRRDDDRGRPRRRRHPARRPLRPGRARPRHRQGPVDRPAGRAAGLAPACASRAGPTSAAPCANGRPSTASSAWSSTIPTIRPSCAREQERQVLILADACRRTGHDLLLEVIPGKSDSAGRRDARSPAPWPASTSSASIRTGGSCRIRAAMPPGRRSPPTSRRTTRTAAASCCSGWKHPRPSWWRRSRWRAGIRSARASPSAGPSSPSRPRTGSPAGSTTSRRSRPWRPAIAA